MRTMLKLGTVAGAILALTACGHTIEQKAATGAGTGAVAGAAVAGPVGAVAGAAVGGVAGAIKGQSDKPQR